MALTNEFAVPSPVLLPAMLFAPTPRAARRTLEFFTAQINNDHTRRAYLNATRHFAQWCEAHDVHQLRDVPAYHVAAFLKDLESQVSAPTVKEHLAAMRMLFDWLSTGQIIELNMKVNGVLEEWGGTLETAQQIADHESPRTTKLYDRRRDGISLDEVERIAI